MFNNTPSDRMQLVGLGELLNPASCMVCGNGTFKEGYVHLGVWFEYEGTMYLCRTCLIQAAELVGCREPGEAAHLEALNESLAKTVSALDKELKSALITYDKFFSNFSASMLNADGATAGESSQVSEPAAEPVQSVADGGESVAEEPIKVKRRTNSSRSEHSDITQPEPGIRL